LSHVYFTDRDLGVRFPQILRTAGLKVERHRMRLLVVIGKAPFPALASSFVSTAPRIEAFLGRHRPPLIAKVYRPTTSELAKRPDAPGRIELSYPR
jgi:hypothetical protein